MKRSRSGLYVVLGCLFAPALLLFLGALLLPGDPRHGNWLLVVLGLVCLAVAIGVLLIQLILPKPPEPPEASDGSREA